MTMLEARCACGMRHRADLPRVHICRCGREVTLGNPEQSQHRHGEGKQTPARDQRLGDWTEQQLQSIGVTKERYKAAKELFGLAPTCGCDARKQWLNSVSDWWRGG